MVGHKNSASISSRNLMFDFQEIEQKILNLFSCPFYSTLFKGSLEMNISNVIIFEK